MSNKDFLDFFSEKKLSPPKELSSNVLSFVKSELQPGTFKVFTKLLSVQAFVGIISLTFCPQFSFSLTNNTQIFHFFHRVFGYYACVSICAALFTGLGALAVGQLLNPVEIQKIKNSQLRYYLSVSALILASFFIAGAEVYLDVAGFWLLGAVVGGVSLLDLGLIAKAKVGI